MEEEGAEVINGGFFPRKPRSKIAETLQGNPVGGEGVGRDIFLAFKVEEKLSGQKISAGLRRGDPEGSAAPGLFQKRPPMGAPRAGWAVSSTGPVLWVSRSKRSMALRVSTPSGEVATMGIS